MALLLGIGTETYHAWSEDPAQAEFEPEQRERASYVLGIYKALIILLPSLDRHPQWLRHPNTGGPFQVSMPTGSNVPLCFQVADSQQPAEVGMPSSSRWRRAVSMAFLWSFSWVFRRSAPLISGPPTSAELMQYDQASACLPAWPFTFT